jgi:hypothetical protein
MSQKIIKLFWLKIFSFATGVNDTGNASWAANISENFRKKNEMAVVVYSGACGKLNHEKYMKSKISWHCPFKFGYGSQFRQLIYDDIYEHVVKR